MCAGPDGLLGQKSQPGGVKVSFWISNTQGKKITDKDLLACYLREFLKYEIYV